MPSIVQNGSVKLVVTQPSQRNEDASLIAAIARGTCWFEELTSGKALSISSIASRERVTDSYVSRVLNFAFLDPALVEQVMDGNPSANETAGRKMKGQKHFCTVEETKCQLKSSLVELIAWAPHHQFGWLARTEEHS